MVSAEKQGQASRLRVGYFEQFQWALGQRGCPWVSDTWPWGDWGRGIVAPSVRANEGSGWGRGFRVG